MGSVCVETRGVVATRARSHGAVGTRAGRPLGAAAGVRVRLLHAQAFGTRRFGRILLGCAQVNYLFTNLIKI